MAHLELNEILQVGFVCLFWGFFCETREGLSLVLPVYVTCEEHLVSGLSHAPCVHIPYVGWFIWEGAGATVTQSSVSSMDSRWRANSPSWLYDFSPSLECLRAAPAQGRVPVTVPSSHWQWEWHWPGLPQLPGELRHKCHQWVKAVPAFHAGKVSGVMLNTCTRCHKAPLLWSDWQASIGIKVLARPQRTYRIFFLDLHYSSAGILTLLMVPANWKVFKIKTKKKPNKTHLYLL